MRAEYDREADALYIWLGSEQEAHDTIVVDAYRNVDVDKAGKAIGIEILGLRHYRVDDLVTRFGLESRVSEINAAVNAAVVREAQEPVVVYLSAVGQSFTGSVASVTGPPRVLVRD